MVTTAVLLATAPADNGGPAAALPWGAGTVLARLVSQLAELGVRAPVVITRPAWEEAIRASLAGRAEAVVHASAGIAEDLHAIARVAAQRGGRVLVAAADVVTHREAIAGLVADPRAATRAVCSSRALGPALAFDVRTVRGRIVGASSPYHSVEQPNMRFLGLLEVAPASRRALADVANRLAALQAASDPTRREDATSLVLVGLVRSQVHVGVRNLGDLFWARPLSQSAAEQAAADITSYDEERARLDAAVKSNDGFFTSFLVSPYSKYIARWAARRGWTPNQVTAVSLAIGVLAAVAFATGGRAGLITGAILLQLSFTTDCVDGQLARYTRQFTRLGAWLDSIFDRAKEYAVFAGLAIGASRSGDPVWVLAGTALALQTVRHAIDFSYLVVQHQALASVRQPPLTQESDRSDGADSRRIEDGFERRVEVGLAGWRNLNRRPGVRWLKKIVAFPIGERFAVISITAAIASARTTFVVLVAWSGFATAYKMAGRVVRSIPR
jgi:Family of unknown function (DUF5941)/CDP-alcohol phosphatidyltransferase